MKIKKQKIRNKSIIQEWQSGKAMATIAGIHKITRQRVHQILRSME